MSKKRGSIIIAMMYAVVLSVIAVSFFYMLGGRATMSANQLKRAQAIAIAEGAIYKAIDLMRAGSLDRTVSWNTTSAGIPDIFMGPGGAGGWQVEVEVDYIAATGELSATVDYIDITMLND